MQNIDKIVEAYVGEYASGKSEVAVNRAIELVHKGRKVNLVDLDIVEPCYTLRPLKSLLSEYGIDVVAWDTRETIGLGEAGSTIKPETRWVLKRNGDIIMDIGYGVEGAKTLNLVEGAMESKELEIFAVINIGRPMTATVDDIIDYVQQIQTVHGLINNSHLGDDTNLEIIQEGAEMITRAGEVLGIPIIATTVDERFKKDLGEKDIFGNQIRYIKRFMTKAFW